MGRRAGAGRMWRRRGSGRMRSSQGMPAATEPGHTADVNLQPSRQGLHAGLWTLSSRPTPGRRPGRSEQALVPVEHVFLKLRMSLLQVPSMVEVATIRWRWPRYSTTWSCTVAPRRLPLAAVDDAYDGGRSPHGGSTGLRGLYYIRNTSYLFRHFRLETRTPSACWLRPSGIFT